jgi:hypothetical protein
VILLAAVVFAAAGCSRQDARLQQHKEHFESLGASTAAIGEAWLAGRTSGTYTSTSLEQVFLLTEQERTALASTPRMLLDPRGAALSQDGERLSRLIATLIHDVRAADATAVRQHLSTIPIVPGTTR